MENDKVRILSTAMLESALLLKAHEANIALDAIPFIDTVAIDDAAIKDQIKKISQERATVIFTSSNAVDAVTKVISGGVNWDIYCMSGATRKKVAGELGDEKIKAVADSASGLAEKIIETGERQVFFFCGDRRRDELPELLEGEGIVVNEVVVYKTVTRPCDVAAQYDAILFFSPSAVESYRSTNTIHKKTVLFAIGNTTAAALKQFDNKIVVSDKPSKEAMMDKVIDYYKNEKTEA